MLQQIRLWQCINTLQTGQIFSLPHQMKSVEEVILTNLSVQ